MEHSEYPKRRLSKLFLLAILLLVPACKSEDPTPELKDPIYMDLLKQEAASKAAIEKEEKKLEGFEKDFEKSEVRSIDRKSAIRDITNAQDALRKHQQAAEYYRIALIKRQVETRASYKRAFAADKPWPDPKEWESYKQDKNMQSVSKNWNIRVPKPGTASLGDLKEEGKAEGGKESAEGEKKESAEGGGH